MNVLQPTLMDTGCFAVPHANGLLKSKTNHPVLLLTPLLQFIVHMYSYPMCAVYNIVQYIHIVIFTTVLSCTKRNFVVNDNKVSLNY